MEYYFSPILCSVVFLFMNSCCKPTPKKDDSIVIGCSNCPNGNLVVDSTLSKIGFGGDGKNYVPEASAGVIIVKEILEKNKGNLPESKVRFTITENGEERKATPQEVEKFINKRK